MARRVAIWRLGVVDLEARLYASDALPQPRDREFDPVEAMTVIAQHSPHIRTDSAKEFQNEINRLFSHAPLPCHQRHTTMVPPR